jgi:hypothetical protein
MTKLAGLIRPSRKILVKRPLASDPETLVSFLINAMYLVGNHRILVSESLGEAVSDALIQIGHRIDTDKNESPRAYQGVRYDRAVFTARALGYGTEMENRAWLQTMRKRLQPGGLLCFHVFDRDRIWNLIQDPRLVEKTLDSKTKISFDPASGRLATLSRENISIRAYNLLEITALLASNGFALERVYGDWTGDSHEEGGARTGRLIVVASKLRVARRVNGKRK